MLPRVRQTHQSRQKQIRDAVAKLITTRGMERVTIGDIAEEVGISEAAVYRHFTSKRQILSEVVHGWRQSVLASIEGEARSDLPALDELERAFWIQLSDAEDHRALSFLIIVEAISLEGPALGDEVASIMGEYMRAVSRILDRGIREGDIRPNLNLEAAATTFFGMIQSTATLWALNHYKTPLAEQSEEMWGIFKRGVTSIRTSGNEL